MRAVLGTVLMVGFGAAVVQAQPAIRAVAETFPVDGAQAGGFVSLYVEAANAAGTTGDVSVTVDPMGVGRSTFVQRFTKVSYFVQQPCATGKHCFFDTVRVDIRLRPGDYTLPITAIDTKGRQATTSVTFHVTAALDSDHDGLPDFWEASYGLDAQSASGDDGPSGDPDGDGISNFDEFRAGTNPRGRYTRFFAEGSWGDAQPLRNCVAISGADDRTPPGPLQVVFIGDNGRWADATQFYGGAYPGGVCPLDTDAVGDRVVEVRVDSFNPLAVERDTTSGTIPGPSAQPQLANASLGVQQPSTSWVFADGHTADGIDEFLLLYNPNGGAVEAEFTYIVSPGRVLASKRRVLAPGVRTTIWLNQDDGEVLPSDVSVTITAGAPILAERAYRYHAPGRTVPHDSMTRGAWTTSTRWYFPDVDRRQPYHSSIVLMNPGASSASITATFTFTDRTPTTMQLALAPGGRRELDWPEIPVPDGAAYSVSIDSSAGIVAERASMGATASGTWRRSALGAMEPAAKWIFPSIGMLPSLADTDLVIQNPSDAPARVNIHMLDSTSDTPTIRDVPVDVPARRTLRVPLGVNDPARTINVLGNTRLVTAESIANASGAIVPVVVERTTYWDADGVKRARAASLIGHSVK